MKKFSLKKKFIIGIISLLIISISGTGFMIYLGFQALVIALSDKYSKIYSQNEIPSDTFLLAVTNTKGELDFIDYRTYQQDKTSSKPSYKLFDGNQGDIACGLKIICDVSQTSGKFTVNKRDVFGQGLTNTYQITANQTIIPISASCSTSISASCSTSKCAVGKKYLQETS